MKSATQVRATKPVRVAADLAEMLTAIRFHEGEQTSEFVDGLLRPTVEERFMKLPKAVRDVAASRFPVVKP